MLHPLYIYGVIDRPSDLLSKPILEANPEVLMKRLATVTCYLESSVLWPVAEFDIWKLKLAKTSGPFPIKEQSKEFMVEERVGFSLQHYLRLLRVSPFFSFIAGAPEEISNELPVARDLLLDNELLNPDRIVEAVALVGSHLKRLHNNLSPTEWLSHFNQYIRLASSLERKITGSDKLPVTHSYRYFERTEIYAVWDQVAKDLLLASQNLIKSDESVYNSYYEKIMAADTLFFR